MVRMRIVAVIAFLIAGVFVAYALANAQATTAPITIRLEAENNSGQTGTATLTDVGNGRTKIEVEITGEPPSGSQPMQVHEGQCGPRLARLVYPLANVEDGKSTTTIDAPLSSLTTGGFAINGHKSEEEYNIYVFCGNIPSVAAILAEATGTGAGEVSLQNATPAPFSPLTIGLQAENNSGQTGTVTLTDLRNGQTKIEVDVAGEPAGASQPMHLHVGQCGTTLARLAFNLTNLENGKSTTVIDAPLSSITTGGFAINSHKSRDEYNIYVLCGNIPAQGAIAQATPTGIAAAATVVAPTTASTEAATATTAASTAGPTEAPTATPVPPTEAPTVAPTATAAPPTAAATATLAASTAVPTEAVTKAPTAAAIAATAATGAATQAPTAAATESTAPATEAATQAPTAAATETTAAATETATTAATETAESTEAATTGATKAPTAAAIATTAATGAATQAATAAATEITAAATETATAATESPTDTVTAAPTETTAAPTATVSGAEPTPSTVPTSGEDPQTDRYLVIAVLGALLFGMGITFMQLNKTQS